MRHWESPRYTRDVVARRWFVPAWTFGLLVSARPVSAQEPDVLLEFHFKPVPNLQIAIWLENAQGQWVRDVFVTQATGKLGIGNRSGRWDFLSSWRAPYGPRPMVLPIWAHRRGKTYPKLIFFDSSIMDHDSLGWHENSSSAEPYFCRPLAEAENQTISTDTMTCPSPAVFKTDKGTFDPDDVAYYPPRNDIMDVHEQNDSPYVAMFAAMNDLDAVTGATPQGHEPTKITVMVPAELVTGDNLIANIEVSLEHDENDSYQFTREDHFIDPRLATYGVEYFGQPSVIYRVELDASQQGFQGTSEYAGYGEWSGMTGTLHAPDATISGDAGSGADRLSLYSKNGQTFRFGVYSHGTLAGSGETGTTDDGGESTGSDGDGSTDTGGDTGSEPGWGDCSIRQLPALLSLELDDKAFDTVLASFIVPDLPNDTRLSRFRVYYTTADEPLNDDSLSRALEHPSFSADSAAPGEHVELEIGQLFGNYEYQFALRYEDDCANKSGISTSHIRTPPQKFQQVEGFCFVATAAYGAPWMYEVRALRWFRDAYLRWFALGPAMIGFYYAYSPSLAQVIQAEPLLRAAVRGFVQPIADTARLATRP